MVDNFVTPSAEEIEGEISGSQVQSSPSKQPVHISDIPKLLEGLKSDDNTIQINSLRGFRRLLSSEKNPPVQQCIDCGAVPMFVYFLQRNDCAELQFEAAWALTNIASTDRTRLIVECGAIPFLSQLLNSPNPDIREQCGWCLGNVAGDGPELRDAVLSHGALETLVKNVAQPASLTLLRNCTWALSNFCRGKPQPPLATVAPALPVLIQLVQQNSDQETVIDATWALSYISDGTNDRIQAVVDLDLIPSLVNMLTSSKGATIVPALRTLGNIVSGSDEQTQAVVDANVLPSLVPLLNSSKKNIRKETCWMLSNIAAGSKSQLSQLIKTPDLLPRVLTQMSSSAEWDVRREASWVISNIATGGNLAHITQMIEHGGIRPICDLFEVGEVRIILLAMEALQAIFKSGIDIERITTLIDEVEGVDKLEALQEHENVEIYDKAVDIIEKYFGGEEENDSENIVPQSNNGTFEFGMQQVTGKSNFDFGSNFMANQTPSSGFTF
jgi:HEAT repeat protein